MLLKIEYNFCTAVIISCTFLLVCHKNIYLYFLITIPPPGWNIICQQLAQFFFAYLAKSIGQECLLHLAFENSQECEFGTRAYSDF